MGRLYIVLPKHTVAIAHRGLPFKVLRCSRPAGLLEVWGRLGRAGQTKMQSAGFNRQRFEIELVTAFSDLLKKHHEGRAPRLRTKGKSHAAKS